jgi:hypothetical protein
MGILRFLKSTRAVAAVEFAMILPIFLLVCLGGFEVPRYILLTQKMARASASMADLVAQGDEPLPQVQLNDLFVATSDLMSPYDLESNGKVIVSSVLNDDGLGPKLAWQRFSPGTFIATSKIGVENGVALLPSGLTVRQGENVIIAEVYFKYVPVFANMIYDGTTLYQVSFDHPRNNNLVTKPTGGL